MPLLDPTGKNVGATGDALIDEALTTVREHFGMPVAYLSRFDGDTLVFRNVSAPGLSHLIKPDDRMALNETYCQKIITGELPSLIRDTADEPICRELLVTSTVPIGSHLSLPVVLADGRPYGMFCCFSPEPNPTLNERDLAVMASFVTLVARQVQTENDQNEDNARDRREIETLLRETPFDAAYQPIVRLSDGTTVGYEALIRKHGSEVGTTEAIFRQAARVGLGIEMELFAAEMSLSRMPELDALEYISINASPSLICDDRFETAISGVDRRKLVVEVTKYSENANIPNLLKRLTDLRQSGVRIAIDDVGSGYSDFQRITQISPDILKIDRSIVTQLDRDAKKRAAIAALQYFAAETGPTVVAEGVEREEEATALRKLGVPLAQGWLFGRAAIPDQATMATGAGEAQSLLR